VEDAADWRGVAAVAEAWGDTVAGWEWEWERWWLGCGGSGCGNDKEGAGMSEADKVSGERGEGCGDVPWWLKAHREAERKAEKAVAIGEAAAVPGTCAGLCESMRGDDVGDALRMAMLLAAYNDRKGVAAWNEMGGQVGGGVAQRTEAEST
jgi:hypothetical protein